MTDKIINNLFIEGRISNEFIAEIIHLHNLRTDIGAHSIFLGQVRSDEADGSRVAAIEYTTHAEMALKKLNEIQASLFEKYQLTGLNIFHSTGKVKAGEICFFVLAVSAHRAEAIAACSEAVERVKAEMPVWGKLILENSTVQWKENK
jgi:molybdopterin synthase catalytic subunit